MYISKYVCKYICIYIYVVLTIFEVAHFVAGSRSPSEEGISLQYSGRKLLRWRLRALQLWKWVIYNCNPWLRCTIFFSSQRLSSPHFSHRIVKVLDFTVKRPVTFNLLPLKLFDGFNTFQWEIELIFILMFLLFEGRCTTQQAGAPSFVSSLMTTSEITHKTFGPSSNRAKK